MLRPRRPLSQWLLGSALAVSSTACIGILGEFQVDTTGLSGTDSSSPDSDVRVLCTDTTAPACGERATCVDTSGKPVCVCNEGYDGPECTSCAAGLQDFDGDRVCKPTCATASKTCPTRASCDDGSGEARCVCAVGYALENDACAWRGALRDPSFEASPSAWELTDFVQTAGAAGATASDRGIVGVGRDKVCTPGGSFVQQTFPMPSIAQGETYALKTMTRAFCNDGDGGTGNCYGGVTFRSSLTYAPIQTTSPNTWTESSTCVGERAYGPNVRLRFDRLQHYSYFCSYPGPRELQFDRVGLVPDPTCPAVGTVVNGNFEANAGWTAGGTSADSSAQVVAGVGNGGSRGGKLTASKYCPPSNPTLTSLLSVPSASVPNAAITMTFKGLANRGLSVDVADGQEYVGSITGDGTYRDVSFCLPEYAKGYTVPLTFRMNREEPGAGITCGGAGDTIAGGREMVIDDVRIESKPTLCPDNAWVNDGGFERNDGVSYWKVTKYGTGSGTFVTSASGAHGGSRYASLFIPKRCDQVLLEEPLTIPPPKPGAGPVLKFFYKVYQSTPATLNVSSNAFVGSSGVSLDAKSFNTWTEAKVCLKPDRSGTRDYVQFSAYGAGAGACGDALAGGNGFFYIDDVVVDTDPVACPIP